MLTIAASEQKSNCSNEFKLKTDNNLASRIYCKSIMKINLVRKYYENVVAFLLIVELFPGNPNFDTNSKTSKDDGNQS